MSIQANQLLNDMNLHSKIRPLKYELLLISHLYDQRMTGDILYFCYILFLF